MQATAIRCQPAEPTDVWSRAAGEMYEFDHSALRGKIVEKFGTLKAFSKAIRKSEQTVNAKMSGKTKISQDDIIEWCNTLDLVAEDIPVYFFTLKLSKS